jgi:hypothetical protein
MINIILQHYPKYGLYLSIFSKKYYDISQTFEMIYIRVNNLIISRVCFFITSICPDDSKKYWFRPIFFNFKVLILIQLKIFRPMRKGLIDNKNRGAGHMAFVFKNYTPPPEAFKTNVRMLIKSLNDRLRQ